MAAALPAVVAQPNVQQVFQDIGNQFLWEPVVVQWLTDPGGLGCVGVNDFMYAATDEAGVADLVRMINGVTNIHQQISRVKQAWVALRQAYSDQEALKRKRQDDTDLDSLLQQPVLDSLSDMFHARCHLTLPPHLAPSDALVSRLAKELDKRVLSVRDVWKSRTLEHQLKRQKRKTQITSSFPLVQDDDDEDVSVQRTVHNYLELLHTLLLAYGIAGVNRLPMAPAAELRTTDSTTCVQAPLDILMRYFWRAQRQVHMLPHNRQLMWLTTKDEQERSKWVDIYRNSGLELGQVVSQVFSQREAMWEIDQEVPSPKRGQAAGGEGGKGSGGKAPPAKSTSSASGSGTGQLKTASTFKDGTTVCAGYNSSKGCNDKKCQDKHLCAVVLPSGRVCGGRHPAMNHPKKGK